MLEKTLTRSIMAGLKARGWKVWKISDRFASGRPDLYALRCGRSIWLEVKVPGGKVTKLQAHEIDDIRAHGGEAYVVRSLSEVVDVLEGGSLKKNKIPCVVMESQDDGSVLVKTNEAEWTKTLSHDLSS